MTCRHVFCCLVIIATGAFLLSCASPHNLTSIAVTPSTASLGPTGSTVQLEASAYYARSSHAPEIKDVTTQVTWASNNTAVVTVDSTGLATAVGVGSTMVTATLNGVSGSASINVTIGAGSLTSLTVIPAVHVQTVYANGQTSQFLAIGTFSNGTAQDLTDQVTWTSANVDVAAINSTGLATSINCAVNSGCATAITASFNDPSAGVVTATSDLTTINNPNIAPLPSLTVYKVGQGTGTVVSSPSGINCGSGASCTANFPLSSTVTLTETPGANSVFVGWSSNCNSNTNLTSPVCTVPMQNNQTVGAIFALNPTP